MGIGLGGAAIISGAASLAGAGIGALGTGSMNRKTRQMYRKYSSIQRRREDTAVQRRMADLEAAGINPLMAAVGNGAQSNQTSIPSQSDSGYQTAGNIVAGIGSNINQLATGYSERNKINSEIKHMDFKNREIEASVKKIWSDIDLTNEMVVTEQLKQNFLEADTDRTRMHATLMAKQWEMINQEIDESLKRMGLYDEQINEIRSRIRLNGVTARHLLAQIRNIGRDIQLKDINLKFIRDNYQTFIRMFTNDAWNSLMGNMPRSGAGLGIQNLIK